MNIAELSREHGVTMRALRFYEQKGLLNPHRHAGVHNKSMREYGSDDVIRLQLVLRAKKLGFTLAEARAMIKRGDNELFLDLQRQELFDHIKVMEARLLDVENALTELRKLANG